MAKHKRKKNQPRQPHPAQAQQEKMQEHDFAQLDEVPSTYQALFDYFTQLGQFKPFDLRRETMLRIERITGNPLICYVANTHSTVSPAATIIDDGDLVAFSDLFANADGESIDIFIVSNGGSAETVERIVRLMREKYGQVRFIVPGNAYSAATLMCFAGDEILMGTAGTLGPIDPQINGIPARAILRAFEAVKEKLAKEGPSSLTAYMPLLSRYELHTLQICENAVALTKELAGSWLSSYMLKTDVDDAAVEKIVEFFLDHDLHKSHGRSIDRKTARELGVIVTYLEDGEELTKLVWSLYLQFEHWFQQHHGFVKMFEDARATNWGRQSTVVQMPLPFANPLTPPPTGEAAPSDQSTPEPSE